jgi:hypothetical protein
VKLPWEKTEADPYWDFFVNTPPSHPDNQIANAIRAWPDGSVFPVKKDIHSPEAMSRYVKDLAAFFGAAATGVVKLPEGSEHPFGIVCLIRSEYDAKTALGHGGQAAVQQGLFVTFNLAAVVREMGYNATTKVPADGEQLALAAGLGPLRNIYVADVIHTDLPLASDTQAGA